MSTAKKKAVKQLDVKASGKSAATKKEAATEGKGKEKEKESKSKDKEDIVIMVTPAADSKPKERRSKLSRYIRRFQSIYLYIPQSRIIPRSRFCFGDG
jgi:hypothetical protein